MGKAVLSAGVLLEQPLASDDDQALSSCRRALLEAARNLGHHDAQAVLRNLAALRDALPPHVRLQVAMMLDWAREGIDQRARDQPQHDLTALRDAYCHARDVLLASVVVSETT